MTPDDRGDSVYALADGVRVFRSGAEIRFRRGVWNHQEATLRLGGQPDPVVRFLEAVFEALLQRGQADAAAIARELGTDAEQLARYTEVLESLRQQQFLRGVRQRDAARAVSTILGGSIGGFEERIAAPRPVALFTDSPYARASANALAREMGLPLDVVDDEVLRGLAAADLTTRTDAVDTIDTVAKYEKLFHPYACVIGCVASPNLSLLRNLNRLLIGLQKPLIVGLIDGPFVVALSTLATETGCFECFEQRSLVRLEDMAVYQEFVRATVDGARPPGPAAAPLLHMLVSLVVSEAYLYSALGLMRLAGRIANVYLPLLEIQMQDLLRVPYCPACGFVSRAQMNELYTSTKRIVDDMLGRIRVEG